ncbi:glycoside hydrolase family 13 protein [Pseudonocardia sp. GCM10023141]|uniref:glycoside hydrolase family 13 protein n=1 Tax=Pseudonocardia sp. GCM10023141 TaxID=3252653 RepID=UPI00361BA026
MTVPSTASPWWRSAVIYQVYIRSFADSTGDGVGDVAGIRSRLPYLRDLGVDAIWINPWYRSPMADAGYDVADYRDIDPVFGTLADAEELVRESHAHGIRLIVDIVPNHTSDQHAWFQAALAAAPGSPERARYIFWPGRGEGGALPPNDWQSNFGGPAWTRTTNADGTAGDWYLHLFAPEQPDLDWNNPEVHTEFESILRFWLDRGVDGFRIDVAHGLVKQDGLPDTGVRPLADTGSPDTVDHPFWDRDGVHEIYQEWRRVTDAYDGDRTFVAEAWVTGSDRLARYLRSDELHTAFNFSFLGADWDEATLRTSIDATLASHASVGAPPTWVLSNHDVVRVVTRYGRAETGLAAARTHFGEPVDLDLGTRRARAAALLMLALPGGAYVYQGEELGLWEVEDIPEDALQDPTWTSSGHTVRGRDGCRVPIPWSGDQSPFGFSPAGATAAPWLPQPASFKSVTAQREQADPDSMHALYQAALRLRREHPALGDGTLTWHDAGAGVLSFDREPGLRCVVNLSAAAVALPEHREVLLASGSVADDTLAPDTAVWLAL